jgi:hypothetical protein
MMQKIDIDTLGLAFRAFTQITAYGTGTAPSLITNGRNPLVVDTCKTDVGTIVGETLGLVGRTGNPFGLIGTAAGRTPRAAGNAISPRVILTADIIYAMTVSVLLALFFACPT